MRIGINASFLRKPSTGIGQVTTHFLQKLVGCQIPNSKIQNSEFFLYCEENPVLDFRLPENIHIRTFLPLWKRDDMPRKYLWERALAQKATADGCDVFLSLYQSTTITPKSMQHTMVVHDIIPRLFPEYRKTLSQSWYWKMVEKGVVKADNIVTTSEHTKNDIVRELHISENNISVASLDAAPQFHQIISPERVAVVLKKYNLSPKYIYHGGGLEIRKNTEKLLRAYALLSAGNEEGAAIPPLVISGKIFDTKNKLATDIVGLVRELRLEKKVKLLGFVPDEDLPALYRGALFFVYPSLYEGFGLPVLEALCQNVPVLTSQNSSLPEVAGKAALYVDPTDIQAIASQLKRLLTDETLRATLVSESAPQAARFDWGRFVQKILTTLKQ